MANRIDGKTKNQGNQANTDQAGKIITYGDDGVEVYGNEDAKKLAAAYKSLSKDGLSAEDMTKLKKLDKELKGAEYKCMSEDVTLVVQEKNGTQTNFVVLGHGHKQDCGFIIPQLKPSRKL